MKTKLPKRLLAALVASMCAATAEAGYYSPTTITESGEMQLGTKAASNTYTIDAKDSDGAATVTGNVKSGSALYVRDGVLTIGNTQTHNTVELAPQGGGQLVSKDGPTILSVAGKNAQLVIDNATVTSSVEASTSIGGADGNGSLIIQNGGKYLGGNKVSFFVGYPSYNLEGEAPTQVNVHATTEGLTGTVTGDTSKLENRYKGEYTPGAEGTGTSYGRGVVTVTGKSELVTGYGGFYMQEGEMNVQLNSTVKTGTYTHFMGDGKGATSKLNVESGSTMSFNGALKTGRYSDASTKIKVNSATLNMKGGVLGVGTKDAATNTYKANNSVTTIDLQDKAVMNLTGTLEVGCLARSVIDIADTASIVASDSTNVSFVISEAGVVNNYGEIAVKTSIEGGSLTLDAGSKMADITMTEGDIYVNGATSTGALTLNGGTITFAAKANVAALMTVNSLAISEDVTIVLKLSDMDFAQLDNKSFSLFQLAEGATTGSVDDLTKAHIVFTNGAQQKVGTVTAADGVVTVTDTKLVPEPTTATLSLLALAALAARRRRR